jgi:hypothetical protein
MHAPRPFIHEDFLLGTRAARRLYHEFAARRGCRAGNPRE